MAKELFYAPAPGEAMTCSVCTLAQASFADEEIAAIQRRRDCLMACTAASAVGANYQMRVPSPDGGAPWQASAQLAPQTLVFDFYKGKRIRYGGCQSHMPARSRRSL